MKSLLAITAAFGLLATTTSAVAMDPPKAPSAPTQKGQDVKEKPDGFKKDVPRVPDTSAPKTDAPAPNKDPKEKPDGWVPDTPKVPD